MCTDTLHMEKSLFSAWFYDMYLVLSGTCTLFVWFSLRIFYKTDKRVILCVCVLFSCFFYGSWTGTMLVQLLFLWVRVGFFSPKGMKFMNACPVASEVDSDNLCWNFILFVYSHWSGSESFIMRLKYLSDISYVLWQFITFLKP